MTRATFFILETIAQRHLGIKTLSSRDMPSESTASGLSLDLHELSVTQLTQALEAAYEQGRIAGRLDWTESRKK